MPARPLPYEPPQLRYTYLGHYVLTEDFAVTIGGRTFVVPVGATTDLASTPRILWNLLPPTGVYEAAAVIHDWWCRVGISRGEVTSRQADGYFRDLMGEAGVGLATRWAMWAAVRIAAPRSPNRRPSGIVRDLPRVVPIAVAAVAVAYAIVLGADRLAHWAHLLP